MPSDQFVPYGRHRLPLSELFDLLESEYIELERATMNPRSFSFATSMDNMMKNRYFNILANEDTLFPPLAAPSATPPAAPTPYINANAIDLQVNPLFVASQAPTPSCMADFFTTLLEQRISLIIMLTDTVEGVMPKADPYWPLDSTDQRLAAGAAPEEEMSVPGTNIVVCKDPQRPFTRDDKLGLIWRPMLLKQPDRSPHRLLQVQYVGWPDHGVPSTTEGFDRLIELTRSYSDLSSYQQQQQQKQQQPSSEVVSSSPEVDANLAQLNATGPVLVHCSAGIGRTGTFIGAYTAISRLATKRLSEKTIQQVVLKMRRARFGMVQRFEQYIFIHQVTMNALGADTSSFAAMAPRRAMDYDVKVMQAMKVMKEREALKRQVQGKP